MKDTHTFNANYQWQLNHKNEGTANIKTILENKPSRVGTHRQQNPILSSTLSTNEALSSHECMGSSPTSYNDNHMDDSSHSHPNDTPSCEPCPPSHTVHLPSIICNHSPPSSFHCSISGRCLSSLDEQWVYACNTPQSDLDKHSRSHSRCFKRSRFTNPEMPSSETANSTCSPATWKEQLPNNALVITAISSSYQVSCYEQNR